jgi:NADH:ubiquinone oxidoreductase subunit 5 (subunit L)/multisubunit Na+/H+ antiporter MnhA subunit
VALRQERLKLLVAYSTVAQIGYLFLMFPLAFDVAGNSMAHGGALTGGLLQAVSHATAKAGMFMAAGLIYAALGHDRIADLAGVARAMPVTVLAFALAGLALMGVVPSGAYLAKKLLLDAADGSGQWWWEIVLQGGAVFTAGYVVLVLVRITRQRAAVLSIKRVSRLSEIAALSLSLCSLLLCLAALGPVPGELVSNPFAPKEIGTTVLVLLGGTLLAAGLSRQGLFSSNRTDASDVGSLRRIGSTLGQAFAQADLCVRRWLFASLSLLTLAALFAGLLVVGVPR